MSAVGKVGGDVVGHTTISGVGILDARDARKHKRKAQAKSSRAPFVVRRVVGLRDDRGNCSGPPTG